MDTDFATGMRANFERKAFSCDKADSGLAGKMLGRHWRERSSAASRHRLPSATVGPVN
jgi:hypothetical protein